MIRSLYWEKYQTVAGLTMFRSFKQHNTSIIICEIGFTGEIKILTSTILFILHKQCLFADEYTINVGASVSQTACVCAYRREIYAEGNVVMRSCPSGGLILARA